MTKNILYLLIGTVFSFFISERAFATDLGYIPDHSLPFSSSGTPKKVIGADYLLPFGEGEVSLFDDYTKHRAKINLHKVRSYLMARICRGKGSFIGDAICSFGFSGKIAEGLYQDYKPIYDVFREAYEQDSEKGQDLFINKAVSQFKIDAAYARTLYDALKPSPTTLARWQDYKQASSSCSSSSSSSAATTPLQETAEEQLKKLLLSNTLNSGSAAAAKTPPLQEEKEQTLEEPPVLSRKPFTGLRRRNLSPPG